MTKIILCFVFCFIGWLIGDIINHSYTDIAPILVFNASFLFCYKLFWYEK